MRGVVATRTGRVTVTGSRRVFLAKRTLFISKYIIFTLHYQALEVPRIEDATMGVSQTGEFPYSDGN